MTTKPPEVPSGTGLRRVHYRVGLGLMVSLLVAITVAVIGWATYVNTRDAIIRLTHARVNELLVGLDGQVRSHLDKAVSAVRLSNMLIGNSVIHGNSDVLARHFTQILRTEPSFSWASYGDELGNFTGADREDDGSIHVVQTTLREGGTLTEYVVGAHNAWTLSSPPETKFGYDPRDESSYKTAKGTGKLAWIGPYIIYDEGLPAVRCSDPHIAPDGSVRGVFNIDFDQNILSAFVDKLHFGANGKIFILTQGTTAQDRVVVAFPGTKLKEVEGQRDQGKLVTAADIKDLAFRAFTAELAARTSRGKLADDEQFYFHQAGVGYLAGYRNLKIEGGSTWLLGAIAPESDFMGVLATNRQASIVIMAIALSLGLLVALLLARRISIPLTHLAAEMEEIGTFQLPNRPRMKTIFREVAAMDQALANMKGSLRSFSSYVPKDLVRAMLASGQEATLQGQTREMTVYFSDIVGMTAIAEGMNPDQLVQHLSRYFDEMTTGILSNGGTVDKFIGDAIMAFWGAPAPTTDHAIRACQTALWSQRRLAELRAAPDTPWLANIRARIGIDTGEVMVGNVGSHDRFNYTVMGDTVNLASRLEGLNKYYGTPILIGESTYRAAQDFVIARPIDLVQVIGKSLRVEVWEPLCLVSEEDPAARELARHFVQGLAAYLARDFRAAADCYKAALSVRPQDRPASILLERCRKFQATPPPETWGGVYVATEK